MSASPRRRRREAYHDPFPERRRQPSRTRILLAGLTLLAGILACSVPRSSPGGPGEDGTLQAILTRDFGQLTGTPSLPGDTAAAPLDTPILASSTPAPLPAFPQGPPRGRIVFACSIDGFDQICLMNADGSGQTRLTSVQATEFYASISPDGSQIFFSSRRDGSFQIYSMAPDGSDLQRMAIGLGSLYAPEVSPDGSQIVFTVESGNRQNIWVMDRDGSNPHQLTNMTGDHGDPTWSPDSTRIAFASSHSGARQLWTMNRDGSDPRQVTDLPNMGGRSSWSTDGARLAFYAGSPASRNIFTIAVDGTDVRQLTNGGDNLGPCYSPYGDWIAFTSFRDWNNEIYIMHPDGSEQTRLTFDPRADWQPRWGP